MAIPAMPNPMSGFLVLPPELQIQVYSTISANPLARGEATKLRGIYVVCQTTHQEVETEIISKLRPLLDIMHEWNTVKNAYHGPLNLQLPVDGSFTTAVRHLISP
jgi:hypothetical protein